MTPESPSPETADDANLLPENPFEAQLQEAQLQQAQLESPDAPVPPPDAPPVAPRRRKSRGWLWLLLLVPVIGASGYIYKLRHEAEALDRRNHGPIVLPERMARVPEVWSADTLATRLEKNHKILSAAVFREAAAQVGLKNVTPGSYFLPAKASPLDLARSFKAGPTHIDVTFPEGFTAQQFAARLEKKRIAGAEKLSQIPIAQLEGKLFPSTYEVPLKGNGTALIALFEDKWREEMAKLPRPFPKIGAKTLTPMQVVTLASLVEREAASREEMPLIAGVLVGRLRRPMRLQVDASIQYARLLANQGHKGRLSFQDLEIHSPFNTYRNDGLPPTPICNPGAAALRAAARPTPTDALFYVHSPKLKRHLFAKDFEQHKRNIAQVRRERDEIQAAASGN